MVMPQRTVSDWIIDSCSASECGAVTLNRGARETLLIAIRDGMFIGEYIDVPRIQHMNQWMPVKLLSMMLDVWRVPMPEIIDGWEMKPGASFYRVKVAS